MTSPIFNFKTNNFQFIELRTSISFLVKCFNNKSQKIELTYINIASIMSDDEKSGTFLIHFEFYMLTKQQKKLLQTNGPK